MKSDIHPTYYTQSKVSCACGNAFTTGSTIESIHVQVCSACHPFYTGKMKFVDAMGRVEKFQKKQTESVKLQKVMAEKRLKKIEERKRIEHAPKTLREMLLGK